MASSRSLCLALALLLALGHRPAHAADRASAERVLNLIYGNALYESEVDRLLAEADGKSVFGGAGSTAAGRARDRALTRNSMLTQRDSVIRQASERVAYQASDTQLRALTDMAADPHAAVDQALLGSAVTVVKRGFIEAAWDHMARFARSNAEMLCRKGERTFCP